MKKIYVAAFFVIYFVMSSDVHAQIRQPEDSLSYRVLDSIVVTSSLRLNTTPYLPEVEGMTVYSGKKTNNILFDPAKANLSAAVARTLFSQVSGVTIWDMSGTGGQINIGSRGTDSHRAIEMNMRQNGYNINSDVFGYPEAHYTPAMQGVQKVELLRGSSALQFGPQFGGMFNYLMKEGDTTKIFAVESEQTAGSYGYFNSYNSIGGTKGKWRYFAYFDHRQGDGWRDNAAFVYNSCYANLQYMFSQKGSVSFQFSRMGYREQIAGGLTDEQFTKNARASTRTRNYFSPIINIPAIVFNYRFSDESRLQITSHYLFGQRNSVQFLNPGNIADTINTSLGTYNPRQVDRDYYSGFTIESRYLHNFSLGSVKSTLATGVRFFDQTTKRKQKGVGTTGSDFNLSLLRPYGIELNLHSTNIAVFAENIFRLSNKLSFTPGFRIETIETQMDGVINNAAVPVDYSSKRSFPLFGAGVEYLSSTNTQFYGNISQAYRPSLYANVTPADRLDIVDPDLKDSKGYDVDFGYRGKLSDIIKFDVNAFYLFYGNRIGQLSQQSENGSKYLFTTNIGNAVSKGFEAYVSFSFARLLLPYYASAKLYRLRIFNSLSYTHATYTHAQQNVSGSNVKLDGNWVENTPRLINKTGLAWQHKMIVAQLLFTYVGKSFSDANNSIFSDNGVVGKVPEYKIWDFSSSWRFLKIYSLSLSVNNLFNTKYFSRRINMYPGPGILPADGRSFYLGFGVKI